MEVLSVSALSLQRPALASRGSTRGCGGARGAGKFKMDEHASAEAARKPVFTSSKSTRCFRPKEWSREAEEGAWRHGTFRVQQAGWRDLKEYMETYGEPDRWENGLIQCTRVKSNGYYTYWRPSRECDDKYLHTVKLFEYTG